MYRLIILFMFTSFTLYGEVVPQYQIISDTTDTSVPSGKCKIYGTTTQDGVPIPNCKIATTDRVFATVSDANGNFELVIDSGRKQLYMFQIGYREIVTQTHLFGGGRLIHLDFYLRENDMIYMEEKPVIYLYSTQNKQVKVEMQNQGSITFTYPEYNNGWEVSTSSDGELTSTANGKKYPYLFWEGTSNIAFTSPTFAFEGFCINTDSTISFLENTLTQIGLNHKEQADFITYWGPRLQQGKQALIQFLVDEEYNQHVSTIKTSPQTQSSKRVYMLFTHQIPEGIIIESQSFQPFQRKGLTLIEWGGTQISNNQPEN